MEMQPKAAPLKLQASDERGSSNSRCLGAFTQGSQTELALPSLPCHVCSRICLPSSIPKPQLLKRICSQTSSVSKGWLVLGWNETSPVVAFLFPCGAGSGQRNLTATQLFSADIACIPPSSQITFGTPCQIVQLDICPDDRGWRGRKVHWLIFFHYKSKRPNLQFNLQ